MPRRRRDYQQPSGGLRKSLNKTNQFWSEKFGRAKPSTFDEEFTAMEKRVAVTEKMVDEIIHSVEKFLYPNPAVRARMRAASAMSRLFRRNRDSRSAQQLPEAKVGDTMLSFLESFDPPGSGADTHMRSALESHGNAFKMLADLRHAFEEHVTNNFIKPLGDTKKDISEIHTLRHKLESRRLDYDCRKRKKGNGDAVSDEELHQAEEKFEQSKKQTRDAMKNFIERDAERITALRALKDEMIDFHRSAMGILQKISQNDTTTNRTQSANQGSVTSTSKVDAWGDDQHGAFKPRNNVVLPASSPPITAPPSVAIKQPANDADNPFTVYYRALYDCEPGNDEPASLSFKEGDIIAFVEECDDKQWFFGSVEGRSGYVPYNYVQIIEEMPQA